MGGPPLPPKPWVPSDASFGRNGLRRHEGRRPCPLEVVAAQPPRHIHGLTDPVTAGHGVGLHGTWIQRFRGHAAHRHLGLSIAFRACRLHRPMRQGLPQLAQPGVPDLGQATGFGQPLQRIGHTGWHERTRKPGGRGQPAPDQSSRQHGSQHRPQLLPMGLSGQADTAR